ncbi:MAG: AGE family epimerase/isomerase, partial [Lachnospiraceae bacterium]|nr:AGE family epimerase/isomerase [Lachnospiraceae bacterium]
MKEEILRHLTEDIIPFWENLLDKEYGGFYGRTDYDLCVDKKALKGGILNSRITWFFSNAYTLLKDESLLAYAKAGYEFLRDRFIDKEEGGVFWNVSFDGKPFDTMK